MNLDRFSWGLPDPQNILPVTYCAGCGGEIYPDELVWRTECGPIHKDTDCLKMACVLEECSVEDVIY